MGALGIGKDYFQNTSTSNVSNPVSSWSFSGAPETGKSGGGMAFDPVTLGLGIANIGAGLFTAGQANRTRQQVANAQMAAAADQLKWQTQLARESAYGGLASDLGNRVFSATTAPDLEFGRQREAAMFAAGPLGERQLALDVERGRRELGLKGSAEAKKLRQEERRAQLKKALAERQGQMAGMFGRIAPIDVSTMFV
jgi:hypothetical protein